ncbi:MAG: TolC family protein, partial [Rhodocyclaceae bacterium]|nr:TolC family protein [Rhodocyclaceae bacterium]
PMPQAPDTLALSLPAETLRQRPDVRAAEHQIHAAQARVSQASAARLPDFSLSGSLGLTATRIALVSSGSTLISTLIAVVSAPLFDGGGLRAQVRVQEAALDEALFAYQATVLAALTDVEDALTALRGDRERFVRLQQAADAASNAALMARQRFSSGLVDFQVVLETQRTQLTTQDTLAITRADVSADHVRLYKALGGGWLPDSEISLAARERGSSQPQTP